MGTNFESYDESPLGEAFCESPVGEARNGDGTNGGVDYGPCSPGDVVAPCGLEGTCLQNTCTLCENPLLSDSGCSQLINETPIGGGDCLYNQIFICCNTTDFDDCADCGCS